MLHMTKIHQAKRTRQFIIGSDTTATYTKNHVRTSRYTKLNFLPNATIIQFRRLANVYFLITGVLQCIDALSTLTDKSSIVPFIIVIVISVIREGIEDIPRQKTDTKVNNSIATQLSKDGQYKEIKWRDVTVGDILLVKDGEEFPADLVLLKSAHENGSVFIETANLDGEKNLKPKYAPPETAAFFEGQTLKRKELYHCSIYAQSPDPSIYRFEGAFIGEHGNKVTLTPKQLLMRGSRLESVDWILGAVVYTGHDTKLMRNAEKAKTKVSRLEFIVNRFIIALLCVQAVFCAIAAIGSRVWNGKYLSQYWYIPKTNSNSLEAFLIFLIYYILMYAMIPIALIITMEIVKIIQALLMMCDENMFSADKEKGARVFCSSINEELGLVDYVFSDKTGTLTSNEMVFKRFVIGKESYGKEKIGQVASRDFDNNIDNDNDNDATANVKSDGPEEESAPLNDKFANTRLKHLFDFEEGELLDFVLHDREGKEALRFKTQKDLATEYMQAVATCHDCIAEKKEGELIYQGQSQDEIRLVETASDIGFKFLGGNLEQVQVETLGKVKDIKLLHIFEFNSDRKRMSTLVRDGTMIKLYIKGADNVILDRLRTGVEQPNLEFTNKKLEHYSQKGYRTLVYAMKIVSEEEFIKLKGSLDDAATDEHREEKIAHIADELEKGLYLLGCTAVEDKLQDNVPEVIHDLLRANIKVWMLTGDKLETAENIAHSCRLITGDMHVMRCSGKTLKEVQSRLDKCKEAYHLCITEKRRKALIIEGEALGYILHDKQMEEVFIQIILHCDSVVCCRATPRQKAEIVRIVKDRTGKVTLAIGDGANDVNMIQAANIGVGIYGHEGVQAVQASDFGIPEFQCLWKLTIIHGRWCYMRISQMIFYFFYKSLLFCLPQFYFGFINGFSGQTLFDDYYFNLYDLIFTSLPIGALAAAEKDLDYRIRLPRNQCTADKIFVENHKIKAQMPLVYAENKAKPFFTVYNLIYWNVKAAVMAAILFVFSLYGVGNNAINNTGITGSLWFDSIILYSGIIATVSVSISVQTRYWNIIFFVFLSVLSLAIYFAFIAVYGLLNMALSSGTYGMIYQSVLFYAYIAFFTGFELLIDLTREGLRRTYRPTLIDALREQMRR